ncbi:MAG TPA: ADOP family duplicated permease [Acidobacteriaceae bacterium]|jgi:predicted permease|nr:ADOP family duplicated permease [Acidobacteriaceae bacterium]
MSLTTTLRCWWQALMHPGRLADEAEQELRFHEEAYAAELVRQGLAPDKAARRARLEMGQPETHGERYRSAVGLGAFDELSGDVRFGLRSLVRNPAYAAVGVLSLALGIGATTAMFSLMYAVLLHPFPYAGADRIVNPALVNEDEPSQLRWFALWKPQFAEFGKAQCIESLLGFRNKSEVLTEKGLPEDVLAVYLTENAGRFFGVRPVMGRMIEPSDAAQGGQPVAVLNYHFWQQHFQGARGVLGRTLELDHIVYTIVGVMPRSFAFDDTTGVGDVYLPGSTLRETAAGPRFFIPWVKLKHGVTAAQANAQLNALVHDFARQNPRVYPKKFRLALQPIGVPYRQSTGRALSLLLAGVLVLLLIGCANCSILLLARGAARRPELAVRSALGASRWRIARQLLVEAMTISVTGAALGAAASWWLAHLALEMERSVFPAESVIRINLPVLGFSVGLALLSGLLFGLAPALRLSQVNASGSLRAGRRIAAQGAGRRLHTLIAAQIALTLLLLATAGMAAQGFLQVMRAPLGYQPKDVMQAGILMHYENAKDWSGISPLAKRVAFVEQVRRKIAAVPGVLSVAVGNDATPPYSGQEHGFQIEGRPGEPDGGPNVRVEFVSPGYFATLAIPLLHGRMWDEAENARGDGVAVVNAAFAREYLSKSAAVGQQLRIPDLASHAPLEAASAQSAGWREIVGVAGDARDDGVDRPVIPAVYVPFSTFLPPYAQYEIRTQGEPMAYLHAIREAVASVEADEQVGNGSYDLQAAIEHDALWSRERLFSILFGFFSGLALALALVGLFSVVAWSVARRTAEFGIRLALGAPRGHIFWIAARAAAVGVALGIAAGGAAELALGRTLAVWMNNRSGAWGSTLEAAWLLLACSAIACGLAARRAVRLHPTEALRCE